MRGASRGPRPTVRSTAMRRCPGHSARRSRSSSARWNSRSAKPSAGAVAPLPGARARLAAQARRKGALNKDGLAPAKARRVIPPVRTKPPAEAVGVRWRAQAIARRVPPSVAERALIARRPIAEASRPAAAGAGSAAVPNPADVAMRAANRGRAEAAWRAVDLAVRRCGSIRPSCSSVRPIARRGYSRPSYSSPTL